MGHIAYTFIPVYLKAVSLQLQYAYPHKAQMTVSYFQRLLLPDSHNIGRGANESSFSW